MTYKIDKKDLFNIVSNAKDKYFHISTPTFVSYKEVDRGEMPQMAMLESALMFLNAKGLLKELVEIDYTQDYDDNDSLDLQERKPVK